MYKQEGKPDIVLISGHVDFRCGIERLMEIVKENELDPFSNSLFVFCSKDKKRLKMLYFSGAGFYLILYKLSEGKFRWFKSIENKMISYKQMEWLLDGLEIEQKHYNYEVKKRDFQSLKILKNIDKKALINFYFTCKNGIILV